MAFLKFQSGTLEGHLIELPIEMTVIGRTQDADIALDDNSVSNRHAKLWCEVKWFVEDIDSLNLTLHNNAELDAFVPQEIVTGDRLVFGNIRCLFDGEVQLQSRMNEEAIDAIDAAEAAMEKMFAEADQLRRLVHDRDATIASLTTRLEGMNGFVSKTDLEEEIRRIRALIEADAKSRIDATYREMRELEKRYVNVCAKVESCEKQLQEKDDQLQALADNRGRAAR